MNRKYLTLHEAISEGRAEWANVQIPAIMLPAGRKCLNQFCESLFCSRHHPVPSLAEERWYFKRFLGLSWIFFVPRNHWRRWCLLAAFKSHRDAQVYLNTL